MEEMIFAHGLVKYLHILLFVYWLGGDAGVFYSSSFVTNTKLSREARLTAFKIFINLDMLPRYCLALMLTVGGVLAEFVGYEHPLWQTIAIVALGPIWVWVVHTIHAREGTEFSKKLAHWDKMFRVFMIFAIIASVIYHWVTGPLQPYPWIAAKLLIFAGLIFCGFMIRVNIPPFIEGFKVLAATGATPESDQKMIDGMAACRPYVLLIWAGVAISALLGVLKPV
ncbi:MAG: hypothetical protein EBR15_01875 [Gammaproteobacteria bacterium]|jgi:hypothetical protein|nr:hypothetical protein [Gammaproteobacteria bacterium]NBX40174.1 hypothetical protein [Gammaproteobacteria bacterium]